MLWIDFWVTYTPQSQRLGSYEPNRLTQSLLSVECCRPTFLQCRHSHKVLQHPEEVPVREPQWGPMKQSLRGKVCKRSKENGHLGLPNLKIFACGACNGYVTVRKRLVFVFCLGGAEAPDPEGGRPLNERSNALRPVARHIRGPQRHGHNGRRHVRCCSPRLEP